MVVSKAVFAPVLISIYLYECGVFSFRIFGFTPPMCTIAARGEYLAGQVRVSVSGVVYDTLIHTGVVR